jgi:hypothetical protein
VVALILLGNLLAGGATAVRAQDALGARWEPTVSYSWAPSDRWGVNTQLIGYVALDDGWHRSALDHMEAQGAVSYGLSVRTKLGAAYLYRWDDPLEAGYASEHRVMQQVGIVTYLGDRRLAHRLRTEQRIRTSSYVNRWRYRLGYEVPLRGARLDPGETYLNTFAEMLISFDREFVGSEGRAFAALGWFFSNRRKVEVGLQYRVQDVFAGDALGHLLLLTTSYYLSR